MSITRTFEPSDFSPAELAEVFMDWDGDEQASFFNEVGAIAADWPGAGMCMQALHIAKYLDAKGRYVIERLADHAGLIPEPQS